MISDSCNGKTSIELCFDNTVITESVKNITMNILLGRIDEKSSAKTFISGTVIHRIDINDIMKCNPDLTNDNTVCCHSKQIDISLPTQMNGFAVLFPNQTLLEYNDSRYQVETFVTTDFNFPGVNSNGQPMFEVTGYTTNLNLRFLRFGIGEKTSQPDVNVTMIIAATVPPVIVVLIIVLLIITTVVLAIKLQRKKGKISLMLSKLTQKEEGLDNANC